MARKQDTRHLLLRDGTWYLNYRIRKRDKGAAAAPAEGRKRKESIRRSLKTGDLATAQRERDRLLAVATLKDETDRAKALASLVTEREQAVEAAAAEVAAAGGLPLAKVWDRYPYTTTTNKRHAHKRKVRDLAASTARDYLQQWGKFTRFMAEHYPDVEHVEALTVDHANAYSLHIREDLGLSGNRHNKLIQTASVVIRGAGRPDPFAGVDYREHQAEHHQNLEAKDLEAVFTAAEDDRELLRLFRLGAFTGLRLKDCCLLDWQSVDLTHNRLHRVMAKTGNEVAFPLHPVLRDDLALTPAAQQSGPVCPTLARDYAHDRSSIAKRIRATFEQAKLTTQAKVDGRRRKVSLRGFHSFRVTLATECARRGVPRGAVQEWLGHASPEITAIYERWGKNEAHDRILAALPGAPAALPDPQADLRKRVVELVATANRKHLQAALKALEVKP